MYVVELLSAYPVARFISKNKINHLGPKDFIKKIEEYIKNSTNQKFS